MTIEIHRDHPRSNTMPGIYMDIVKLLPLAIQAAEKASKEIVDVYYSGNFQAELKGDRSPLTIADKKAHEIIVQNLQEAQLPVLSEEGKHIPYLERKNWQYFWLVDPLDGTKEFLNRNDEFTVNIALIHNHRPVLGVVAVPVTGEVYYAAKGHGAYKKDGATETKLPQRQPADLQQPNLRVVASRSHMGQETEEFIDKLTKPHLISAGSSLKFILLATGRADIYPRYAPTTEWDTAAAHAILNEIGLKVLQYGKADIELEYNKENLLNPSFLAI